MAPRKKRWSRRPISCRNDIIALYDDEINEEHALQFSSGTCSCLQCLYLAKKTRWQTLACMECHPRFTWLGFFSTGIGCVVCWAANAQSLLAQCKGGEGVLNYSALTRHTRCDVHRKAEAQLFEKTVPYRVSPPTEWKTLWSKVRTGAMGRHSRKERLMEWCLAEAIRNRQREFISGAATLSMSADSRAGRLLMCWSGTCGKTLTRDQGVLGVEKDFGTGSNAYKRAMEVHHQRESGALPPRIRLPPSHHHHRLVK